MSGRLTPLALALLLAGCSRPGTTSPPPHRPPVLEATRYLTDAAYRRAEMVASLVNPENLYSQLRLERYGSGAANDWEKLPEWNPAVEPVAVSELDASGGAAPGKRLGPGGHALEISDAARAGDPAALARLGAEAFFLYPAQLPGYLAPAVKSRQAATGYGLWLDPQRGVGGLLHVAMADGSTQLAYTCATCHATVSDGQLVLAVGNPLLDIGKLTWDSVVSKGGDGNPHWLEWGPGRADVSTDTGVHAVRIPDLRPTKYVTHLQINATVRQRSVVSLALRLETLLITAHGETLRPPREVLLGMAYYLWSLAPEGPARPASSAAEKHGETLFAERCTGCHTPPTFTGPPVALDKVGTDDTIGRSEVRGTGTWRVPSLLRVSSRGPLLHDAALPGLDALFDPARLEPGYRGGRHPGPVIGHRFGLDLDAAARQDLLAYLETL